MVAQSAQRRRYLTAPVRFGAAAAGMACKRPGAKRQSILPAHLPATKSSIKCKRTDHGVIGPLLGTSALVVAMMAMMTMTVTVAAAELQVDARAVPIAIADPAAMPVATVPIAAAIRDLVGQRRIGSFHALQAGGWCRNCWRGENAKRKHSGGKRE
jgi:hypothetical protein